MATAEAAGQRSGGIFRKQAMEGLSAPSDQLDQLLRVTSPRGWLALIALVAVVVGVILYGFMGTAPTTVSGQGLVLPEGGLVRVDSPGSGIIAEVHQKIGNAVGPGEAIATIRTAEGRAAEVVSPVQGHLIELLADPGNVVGPGVQVAIVEPFTYAETAVVYIPAGQGKAIQPGMQVRLSPSTAPSEEFGQIVGTVFNVSEFPVSPARLNFVVNNELITNQIAAMGSVVEVTVGIAVDPDTPSGLKWTSGEGPPFEIPDGTLTRASVILKAQPPAAKLFKPGA